MNNLIDDLKDNKFIKIDVKTIREHGVHDQNPFWEYTYEGKLCTLSYYPSNISPFKIQIEGHWQFSYIDLYNYNIEGEIYTRKKNPEYFL